MDTEYKETSAAPGLDGSAPETATDAGAAEAAPEVSKKTPPVWKWLAPVLLVLAAAAVILLLIGRKSADDYIAELNYDNGGLVTYDNQYVYYLAPYHINSEDKRIVVYEVDPSGDESRVICKENTIKAIRSAGSELYCLGAKGSKGAPYLAHIDKTSGELTVLRRFPAETRISYFLVRNSDLFYCADGTLYKGTLESAEPSTDAVLLENCRAVHFSGKTVYYSSEDEILAYDLRSGKSQPLFSAQATQICRKGDTLFFMNSDGIFSAGCKGREPKLLAVHDSSEANLSSVFSLYNGNILYEYSTDIIGLSDIIDSLDSDKLSLRDMEKTAFMIGMAMLNGHVEYISEDGGEPAERPVCFIEESSDISDFVSGFYITPYQTYFSTDFASYSLVNPMKFS